MTLWQRQENFVCNRRFPFLLYYCEQSPIATKPHNKAIYDTSATAGISRLQPQIPVPTVLLRTFSDCHKPHSKAKCGKFQL
jgi:hypothetical protein